MIEPSAPVPLESYPAFRASRLPELVHALETQLAAKLVRAPHDRPSIDAKGNRFKLPLGELWLCSYAMPAVVRFPAGDYVRIQFQHAGAGATAIGGDTIAVTERQACASTAATEIHFGPDYQQLVWRVSRNALVQKIAAITGEPLIGDLSFEPALDLDQPLPATMKRILNCLVQAVDTAAGAPTEIVLAELEQALLVAFLAANDRASFDKRRSAAAPWQVRRAEEYIAANWNKPILIDDLVAVTGTSARTLFRTFKQSRGCSPLEFARRIRLETARRMLEKPERPTTVTDVAMLCGFRDLGHFTKSFRHAFGELPSAVLNRTPPADPLAVMPAPRPQFSAAQAKR